MAVRNLTLLCASLPLFACGFSDDGDYAVIPSWLINGVAPDEQQCAEFGADRVEFRVLNGRHQRVLEGYCEEAVEFEDGDLYGGFITTDSFDYTRTYEYELRLLDSQGHALRDGVGRGSFRVYSDDYVPYLLDPVELFDPAGDLASFSGAWTLSDSCAGLAIDRVDLLITTRIDPDFYGPLQLASAACEEGFVASDGPALAYGHYLVKYQALAANDSIVDESAIMEVIVDREGEVLLDTVRFDGE